MTRLLDVVVALTRASRGFRAPQDLVTTLHALVAAARDLAPGVDHAGLALRVAGEDPHPAATTDDLVRDLTAAQVVAHDGPDLDVLDAAEVVRVDDLATEVRWPGFVRQATGLGLRSYAGVRVLVDDQATGVLALYSRSVDALPAEAVEVADLVAAHAGLVLSHSRRIDNLNAALESRKTIGLALGLTMQRLDLDERTAFAYLTRVSATTETKLRDVATAVVERHLERLAAGG